jgi:glycosyltransferase involved in cell wall biosynthesis
MEGFGLTALEAMACGTPVVVSDRGALPEVVAEAGLVVAPDVDAVSGALERVLSDDDLAARSSAAGRARAVQFTWAATAAHWRRAVEAAVG